MTLPSLLLTTHRLDPAEAEVRIDGALGVTGRFMGPRCHYASTVEVAYYVKPMPGGGARVIVPEPSFWDPQTPFLYEAILQAEDGTKLTRRHGLRTLQLTAAGLRVNRRPFRVQGVFRRDLDDAAGLRARGVNTILCPFAAATTDVWDQADVLGFFVLGLLPRDREALARAAELKEHPSCLGWILDGAEAIDPTALQIRPGREPLLGLRADALLAATPPWVQFVAGPASLSAAGVPWLFVNERGDQSAGSLGFVAREMD